MTPGFWALATGGMVGLPTDIWNCRLQRKIWSSFGDKSIQGLPGKDVWWVVG